MRTLALLLGMSFALTVQAKLPAELPADLDWITNLDEPLFASPAAEQGGTLRLSIQSFPLTLRRMGPDSNGSFAGFLRPNQMSLVVYHPETRRPIPSLASHWAFGADGRSMFYRIDADARWSDGVPVTGTDFEFTVEFMRSKHVVAPWYANYYTDVVTDVKAYGDKVIGVEGATAKPRDEMLFEYGIGVVPKHFHVLDENWVRDNNWKVEPNTGPYQISEVRKGKYIQFERKKDWWAGERRYYQNRFNPDRIRVKVIRDINISYQHFMKGDLDSFGLVLPQFWHEKAKGENYDKGYINRYWFYNETVQPSSGLFLNEDAPTVADRNVRYALAHALNFDRVINTVLRGDYARMHTFNEGFGEYDNTTIRQRPFDLNKSREYLVASGWVKRGPDGILVKDGQRLSIRITYGAPHHTERLVILREEAKKAGIELELQLLDGATSFKQMLEKKHQVAWMAWGSQGLSPRYWQFWHSDNAHKPQTNNLMNHDDPAMDAMIDEYRAATDKARRVELAHALEQMIFESGSMIASFKVPYTRSAAWRWMKLPDELGTRTSGSLFNPFELSAGIYSSGGLFWIDLDEKKRVRDARDDGEAFPMLLVLNEQYKR
jgi:microcin C transport system substrate-binding protein